MFNIKTGLDTRKYCVQHYYLVGHRKLRCSTLLLGIYRVQHYYQVDTAKYGVQHYYRVGHRKLWCSTLLPGWTPQIMVFNIITWNISCSTLLPGWTPQNTVFNIITGMDTVKYGVQHYYRIGHRKIRCSTLLPGWTP